MDTYDSELDLLSVDDVVAEYAISKAALYQRKKRGAFKAYPRRNPLGGRDLLYFDRAELDKRLTRRPNQQ